MYRYQLHETSILFASEHEPENFSVLAWLHDTGTSHADEILGRTPRVLLEGASLLERLVNPPHPDVLPYRNEEAGLVITGGTTKHPSGFSDYHVRNIIDNRGKVIARIMGHVGADSLVEHLNRTR